jgi:hypothetical protein
MPKEAAMHSIINKPLAVYSFANALGWRLWMEAIDRVAPNAKEEILHPLSDSREIASAARHAYIDMCEGLWTGKYDALDFDSLAEGIEAGQRIILSQTMEHWNRKYELLYPTV